MIDTKLTVGTTCVLTLAIMASGCCKKKEEKKITTPFPVATSTLTATQQPVLAPGAVPKPQATQEPKHPLNYIPPIPPGRSAPPTVSEWAHAQLINTQGANSHPANCFMKIKREWLKVHCEGPVTRIAKMSPSFGVENSDYYKALVPNKYVDVVVRLRRATPLKMRIVRTGMPTASLFVLWPSSSPKPTTIALGKYFGDPDGNGGMFKKPKPHRPNYRY